MINRIHLEQMPVDEFRSWLINVHEKYYIELKSASELPHSIWESYSSFSNTSGGYIILGVEEGSPQNNIKGVGNAEKILSTLWNQCSNPNKVSFRNIDNQDVHTVDIDGNTIIIIHVKEAPASMKPLYINGKYEDTWLRTGDGDRRATKEELAALFRNAQPGQDSLAAEGFTINDLDPDSVLEYKMRVSKRFPNKNYNKMTDVDFLSEIGACHIDRITGKQSVKRGTLLFLGRINSIKELYPHYHLDYFNRRGNNPRWSDRVSDDEPGDYELNLFNFYSIVHDKLNALVYESFSLDSSQSRKPISDFDETIRECIVNCLAHADYVQVYPSLRIDAHDGWFSFYNPGKMLVSAEQFLLGGDSRPRNEIIMKLFRLLGVSERQGFGGPLIVKTSLQNNFRKPEVITDIEHTEIKVWSIDLMDSYPDLSKEEKDVLRYIIKSPNAQSIKQISSALSTTDYSVRKVISTLVDHKLVTKTGNGPSTKYMLWVGSVEFLAKMQLVMEDIKGQIT